MVSKVDARGGTESTFGRDQKNRVKKRKETGSMRKFIKNVRKFVFMVIFILSLFFRRIRFGLRRMKQLEKEATWGFKQKRNEKMR